MNIERARAYSVELLPDAWTAAGRIPDTTFELIRRELDRQAQLAGEFGAVGARPPSGDSDLREFHIEGCTARYRVDHRRRVVELRSIERAA